jgi:hypothetical protein
MGREDTSGHGGTQGRALAKSAVIQKDNLLNSPVGLMTAKSGLPRNEMAGRAAQRTACTQFASYGTTASM